MNIALLGYGKMGHEIERIALEKGHTILLIIDNFHDWEQKGHLLTQCNAAIDFSMPATAVENMYRCFEAQVPVVIGTTGWYENLNKVKQKCISLNATLFYASNYSIGVNIFFEINRKLAQLLNDYPDYAPAMTEIHHIQKLDAPSGTAISLANDIIAENKRVKKWTNTKAASDELYIQSIREGAAPGTHIVSWDSPADKIVIAHEAKGRTGFAIGAVKAAEWIVGRKGIFTMTDLLKDS